MRSIIFVLAATLSVAAATSPVFASTEGTACEGSAQFAGAAKANESNLTSLTVTPFGRSERGWRIYELQVAHTIGSACAGATPGFAAALSAWQRAHGLGSSGIMTTQTIAVMKQAWQSARPFVGKHLGCPQPPSESELANLSPSEGWQGKQTQLTRGTLDALHKMIAAARAEVPAIAADSEMFKVVSAYRSPSYDAARCAHEHNCNGLVRASCSAHRTGRAVDLFVGALPGASPVSSADRDRLFQTRSAAYRWLVANAHRFGFVNYAFEPWHWEWTGNVNAVATAAPYHEADPAVGASIGGDD